MRIEIANDAAWLATRAADHIANCVRVKPDARLGLPTGNTPIAAYAELSRRVRRGDVDFSRATIYAIDEFVGSERTAPGTNSVSYREHVVLGQRALHCPNPSAQDADEHIAAFADAIRRAGGLDLLVLGIGVNGHIAFNEPGSVVNSRARVVELTETSREAHALAFGSIDAVPTRGMTLGIADLLEAREIVVLASGTGKAAIVAAAIEGDATATVPASWLRETDALWLLDRDAASGLAPR